MESEDRQNAHMSTQTPFPRSRYGYPTADKVTFYSVPTEAIISRKNRIEARNLDKAKRSSKLFSMELLLER